MESDEAVSPVNITEHVATAHSVESHHSELDLAQLRHRIGELDKSLKELKETTSSKHALIATTLITVFGSFVTSYVTAYWPAASKERELEVVNASKEKELEVVNASKNAELDLAFLKHKHEVEQKYLEYVMSENGGDYEYLDRLLEFLAAVETDGQLKAWATSQADGVRKRRQKAIEASELAEAQALEKARVAGVQKSRAEAMANQRASDNARLNLDLKEAVEAQHRAESAVQEEQRKARARAAPLCRPNTTRVEFGRGTADICGEPSRTAYRQMGSWRWTILEGDVRRSCLCEAELANL